MYEHHNQTIKNLKACFDAEPYKPAEICGAMLAFLDTPSIEAGNRLLEMVNSHKTYPAPPEGMKARLVKESLLNLEAW